MFSPNENILTIARIKTSLFVLYNTRLLFFKTNLKHRTFELYFSIWIISHSSQDRTLRSAMERFPLHSWKMELFI